MKKLITFALVVLIVGYVSGQRFYPWVYDSSGNLRGVDKIIATNGIATKVEVASTSNRFETVIFGGVSGTNAYLASIGPSGIAPTFMTEDVMNWQAGYTNLASVLSSVGQPNGIAKLDENGKIDASLVDTITVVFAGGQATE
jgi:hypothetical protein